MSSQVSEAPIPVCPDTSWFTAARFGLFIHWGLYSLLARHEWVMQREEIHPELYEKYLKYFDPDLYDPNVWADAAAGAGMKYFVVTTKHHEGFCLWDSALTDWKVTNSPYGKDLLTPMVKAFRERGLRTGLYHSLIDWHHPEYPVDFQHAMRNNQAEIEKNSQRDIGKYAAYLHGQTRELLTQFGDIDILWYDFSFSGRGWGGKGKDDWQSEKLIRLIRELQPNVIVNNRTEVPQDLWTPEQFQPRAWFEADGQRVLWEACQTLNGSWGYDRDNHDWKSPDLLIRMLVDSVSKGGNMLLNVGPNARGELQPEALDTLAAIGKWMRLNGRSIYGCTESQYTAPVDCRFTQNGNRLYLHIFAWPFKAIHLDGLGDKVEYAQFLHDASEIRIKPEVQHGTPYPVPEGVLTLNLPVRQPDQAVPVIELFLKG